MSDKEIEKVESNLPATQSEAPMGYEDEDAGDLIVPRVKVIQTLSPERKDKIAEEGDILNSLTKDKLNGQIFVPVFKFNNNIWWKDRSDGGGMLCMSRDGKVGMPTDGSQALMCALCRKNEFDNTKQGKESHPVCTKYMNFFGYIVGQPMPIILSFAKTNYGEGKKLFSLAKVTMQNMWHHAYRLDSKLEKKGGNEWFNIVATPAGATSAEDRAFGLALYHQFRNDAFKYDEGDDGSVSDNPAGPTPDVSNTEY